MLDDGLARRFRAALMRWYHAEGRHALPWRLTCDPYAVLISEVMLQQTQVDRVLPYYEAWLARWPGFNALSEASPAEVIEQWAGLGYNRRALALHRLAVSVTHDYGGELPRDEAALRALPGIGPYTASAVRSFAFEERTSVIDTNIGRVLGRVFSGTATMAEAGQTAVAGAAESLLPRRNAREHNLALMDLGAMVCRARGPVCEACPLVAMCAWHARGRPEAERPPHTTERFEDSARFARGRIVDALRRVPVLSDAELVAILPGRHSERVHIYLRALERDGMVEHTGAGWRLPATGGR